LSVEKSPIPRAPQSDFRTTRDKERDRIEALEKQVAGLGEAVEKLSASLLDKQDASVFSGSDVADLERRERLRRIVDEHISIYARGRDVDAVKLRALLLAFAEAI